MQFSKYHGCGNDFIILNFKQVINEDLEALAVSLCDRHLGIGADGLILVKENPLEMLYYNADGSRATMCGNGIRCFAQYCFEKAICTSQEYRVVTLAGLIPIKILKTEPFSCEVNLGKPIYSCKYMGIQSEKDVFMNEIILADNVPVRISSVFMGNVHTVLFVNKLKTININKIGNAICNHPVFKKKTNVNLVQIIDASHMQLITFERGIGITKACGSGACASVAIAHHFGICENKVEVDVGLDTLEVRIENEEVLLVGKSERICQGIIE